MKTIAYTLGHEKSYDEALANEPSVTKIGKRPPTNDEPEGYSGGCLFRTASDAFNSPLKKEHPSYAVYAVSIESTFDESTEKATYKDNQGKDVVYDALLVDSVITHKVKFDV